MNLKKLITALYNAGNKKLVYKVKEFKDLYNIYGGVYDPGIFKVIFLAGGPGSGKSFVAKKTTLGHGLKMVNSDILFEKMMGDAAMDLDMIKMTPEELQKKDVIRNKASDLTSKQKKMFINNRTGLVIDGTGRDANKIKAQKELLENLGYDTYMIFINTSLDTALERNALRKRSVPEDLVKKFWKAVQNNIGFFQKLFGNSNFTVIDNNEVVSDDKLFNNVWKDVMKFVKKPIKNNIAKTWIETELSKKKKKT